MRAVDEPGPPRVQVALLGAARAGTSTFLQNAGRDGGGTQPIHIRRDPGASQDGGLLVCRGDAIRARIDVVDQPGRILREDACSTAFTELYKRVVRSDATVVVLDGEALGEVLGETRTAHTADRASDLEWMRDRLRVHDLSLVLRPAAWERAENGRPGLALVVVVAKHDLFRAATPDLDDVRAHDLVITELRAVMPILFERGTTTAYVPLIGGRDPTIAFTFAVGHALAATLRSRSDALVADIEALARHDEAGGIARFRSFASAERLVGRQRVLGEVRSLLTEARAACRDLRVLRDGASVSIGPDFVLG